MDGIGTNHMKAFAESRNNPAPPAPETKPQEQAVEPEPQPEPASDKVEDQKPEPDKVQDKTDKPEEAATPPVEKEGTADEPKDTDPKPDDKPDAAQPKELDDDAVRAYFEKSRGKKLESLDDLFKEPEPQADPYEGLSDETVQFLKYQKETGRDYKDFESLNRDYTKVSSIDIAREKAISESDGILNKGNVDEYLQEELNIDPTDLEGLSPTEKMKLRNFGKDYLKNQVDNQEKYKQPVERPEQEEMVTLQSGQSMPKAQYENLRNKQNEHQDALKAAMDDITPYSFEVKIDDNGTENTLELPYEMSKQDRLDTLSDSFDLDGFVLKHYPDGKGGINHGAYLKGLHAAANIGKIINTSVHKALAEQRTEFMREQSNPNYTRGRIAPNQKSSTGSAVNAGKPRPGVVRYSPDQFKT